MYLVHIIPKELSVFSASENIQTILISQTYPLPGRQREERPKEYTKLREKK